MQEAAGAPVLKSRTRTLQHTVENGMGIVWEKVLWLLQRLLRISEGLELA